MKKIYPIWAGLTAIAMLVSCAKTVEENTEAYQVDDQVAPMQGITFSASLNTETRSRFKNETSPALEWEDDEPVMIAAIRMSGMSDEIFENITDDEAFTTALNTLIVTDIGHAQVDADNKAHALIQTSKTRTEWLYAPSPNPEDTYLFLAYYPVSETKPIVSQHSGELWYEFEIPDVQDGRSYWKYQIFYNYILDTETENFSTYYTRDEIENGTEVVFNDFQPVNTLLRFRLKLTAGDSHSYQVKKVVITASGTDREIVGKCTSNIVENWLNPAPEGASMTLTLDLDDPVTVSSTAPDDYLYASIISQKDNGYSGTFDLIFSAYDENDNLILQATKTTPDGGLEAGKRYIFDLEMTTPEEPWEYHLDNLSDITVPYSGKTQNLASNFKSYRTRGSESEAVSFTLEYSETGEDGTWTTTTPDWLVASSANNFNGSVAGSKLSMKVMPQTNASVTDTYHTSMAAKEPKNDFDLSLLNVSTGQAVSRTTANCYVVQAPGTYKFPVVYGNGVKGNATNTSAFVSTKTGTGYLQRFVDHLGNGITSPYIATQHAGKTLTAKLMWTDEPGLVTDVAISGSGEDTYISFEVPEKYITHGNAMIAVLADGVIAWSWHIWVTSVNMTTLKSGMNGYKFTTANLGWCAGKTYTYNARSYKVRAVQSESGLVSEPITISQTAGSFSTEGNCPLYQWGRKDPTSASTGKVPVMGVEDTPFKTYYSDDPETLPTMEYSNGKVALQRGITSPHVYFAVNDHDWSATRADNLWSVNAVTSTSTTTASVKSVYDPSPVGFKVPRVRAWMGMDRYNGYWATTTSGTPGWYYIDGAVHFPATGNRNNAFGGENSDYGKISFVGGMTYYWAADPGYEYSSYTFEFTEGDCRDWYTYDRSRGCAIRPVQE